MLELVDAVSCILALVVKNMRMCRNFLYLKAIVVDFFFVVVESCVLVLYDMIWFSQIHGFGSINLKSMQAENLSNVVPPSSRSSNYIALRYCDFPSEKTVR